MLHSKWSHARLSQHALLGFETYTSTIQPHFRHNECFNHFQARQLNEKSKQLEEQDAALQRGSKALASERAQLSQAQSLLESESAASRQLSAELAGESEALSKQRRGLEGREAELQDRLEACDRACKVDLPQV